MIRALGVILILLVAPFANAETSQSNTQEVSIEALGLSFYQTSDSEVVVEELGFKGPFKWACYAENRYRETFRGVHKKRRIAEQRAADACYRWSRRCYYAGCERIISIPF